jgi:hypothetical protein
MVRFICFLALSLLLLQIKGDSGESISKQERTYETTSYDYAPLASSSIPIIDKYLFHPSIHFTRVLLACYRSYVGALRDILFPIEARSSPSLIDNIFEDEGRKEYERRRRYQEKLLEIAEKYHVMEKFKTDPDMVRYGLAFLTGFILLFILFSIQTLSALVAKITMQILFKMTGDTTFEDTPLLQPSTSNPIRREGNESDFGNSSDSSKKASKASESTLKQRKKNGAGDSSSKEKEFDKPAFWRLY